MPDDPKLLRRNEELRRWVDSLIVAAQQRRWYGEIIITIKGGEIELAACKETVKPPPPNPS